MTAFPVYIIGAGPGDPELLTRKAYRLLTEWAEVVVYDRLIPENLLAVIPASAERVYAGKSCRQHVMTQAEINEELVRQFRRGKKVVRLKGGDPFIFGRGGEETEYLERHGVPFEVVPGISAAAGISARFGIPLTHRGLASSVRYITGHQQNGEAAKLDWKGLADPETTLVVYMGLANLGNITENLMKAGMDPEIPAVAVQNGMTDGERVCYASLRTLAAAVKEQNFAPPVTVIIGRVVEMMR